MKLLKKLGVLFSFLQLFVFSSCREPVAPRSEVCLGTVCSVNLFESGTDELYGAIFSRLNEIESKFSVNIDSSQISKINRNAGIAPVQVDDEVLLVLKKSIQIAELSNGAFDPTIGPVVSLWGINTDAAKVPSQSELDATLPLVDFRKVKIVGTEVFLTEKNMAIDLGGIAKGFAADEIVKILESRKIRRAIIDLGGNIITFGKKKGGDWKVGVKNPFDVDAPPILVLSTKSESIVTSGVYERFFEENGTAYHHILSTEDGFPVENGLVSVTIVAKDSMLADGLSTTLFALGKEKGFDLLEKIGEDVSAIFIEKNGKISFSKNLEGRIKIEGLL